MQKVKPTKRKPRDAAARPLLTKQEYRTLVDCMSVVKMIGENSLSLVERIGARTILTSSDYQIGIIDKLTANSEFATPATQEESNGRA